LRENGRATRTHTPNATRTHPKRRTFSPLATPNQRKPNFTLSITQPPHLSIPVPPPVSLFLIPRSPKNKPGHRLPGRAGRARKRPLQHKSLRQAIAVSPKDPHRSQLNNVVSLPTVPPQPSRTILSSSLLPFPTSWPLYSKRPLLPTSLPYCLSQSQWGCYSHSQSLHPSSAYSPFFDAMTKKLNQSFPVRDNPFQVFREAPTSVELLIHNLPLSILPHEPTDLFPSLHESICNAIEVPIFGARFLQSDPAKRAEKRTTLVVVAVDPLYGSRFGESIRLFSRTRTVAHAYSASKSTQCRKCWRFGHSAPLCKEEAQACPICTLLHHRSAHRCANQSCLKGGFERSVVGCCNASPPPCVNCRGQQASFDGTGPIRREILSSVHPPRDQDCPDAPDAGLPQTTPQGPTVPSTVPATPAMHGPCFPPSSESTQPATIRMVRSASAQSSLAAPLPRRNLLGAGSTLFRASTGADWSEPAPTDVHMDL